MIIARHQQQQQRDRETESDRDRSREEKKEKEEIKRVTIHSRLVSTPRTYHHIPSHHIIAAAAVA